MDGLRVRVLSTHLGKRIAERRWQAERIVEIIEREARAVVVVMGDINEWLPGRGPLRVFNRWFGASGAFPQTSATVGPATNGLDPQKWGPRVRGRRVPFLPTYPATWPLFNLDRSWVWPPELRVTRQAPRTSLTRRASDHLPLVTEVRPAPPA